MARIAIIGGGIAGLSAAYDLHTDGRHVVTLLEKSNRLGGKILTHKIEGLIVEGGPDSIFTSKPWAVGLMRELGLESDFEEPIGGGFSLLVDGRLQPVPRALASLMPTDREQVDAATFLSPAGRERVALEGTIPKGSGEDESVASFFRRRFGDEFSRKLAETLLAGIHAGHAELLSMKALFPTYIGREQRQGSLTGQTPIDSSPPRPGFITLRRGLESLVDALHAKLSGVDLRLNHKTDKIVRQPSGSLLIQGSDPVEADHVILAIPAYASSSLLGSLAPEAAELLNSIRHVSTAVVSFAFPASSFDTVLAGNGFLVPAFEPSEITACTFSSLKWKGRAPNGETLIRAFMGCDGGLSVDDFTDDQLLVKARSSVKYLFGCEGTALFNRVDRWPASMPQYEVGHLDLMDRLDQSMGDLPILFAGGSYRGTGVPDCIRQGREAANRVLLHWDRT